MTLSGEPIARYEGGIAGYPPTNPRAAGVRRLDMEQASVQQYREYLRGERQRIIRDLESDLGRPLTIVRIYDVTMHGLAVPLSTVEAGRIREHPDILSVEREGVTGPRGMADDTRWIYEGEQKTPPTSASPLAWLGLSMLIFITAFWIYRRHGRPRTTLFLLTTAGVVVMLPACFNSGGGGSVRLNLPGAEFASPGAALIGAPAVWSGKAHPGLPPTMGEGIVVGVIDSGINPHSPSFAQVGDDGYEHDNPRGRFYGVCDPGNVRLYNPNFPCNNKLIGAWALDDAGYNPVDRHGHGTHVAATAVGNFVREATVYAPSGLRLIANLSGVAPHANLIAYHAYYEDGGFFRDSALIAAVEQAVMDGVDVLNLSLGGGEYDPWQDSVLGLPLLSAIDLGIHVVVSAGNDGPGNATVDTPGDAPWVFTVGSSTHALSYVNHLQLSWGDRSERITGAALTRGLDPAPIVHAVDFGDRFCEGEFDSRFNGRIVICDRGENARVEKGQHVLDNGGVGMILVEVEPGDESALAADPHFLPAVHITYGDAQRLAQWLSEALEAGEPLTGSLSGTEVRHDPGGADRVASYSSRGWNRQVPDVIKPDVVAPGSAILAPVVDGAGYAVWNGTSMASPHVAGVLALITALHPDWTPAQARSAIMTTARPEGIKNHDDQPATPFDRGSGRVDAAGAISAPLVLDETGPGYEAANPSLRWENASPDVGDPSRLNLASLGRGACVLDCGWSRRLTNVSGETTHWEAVAELEDGRPMEVSPRSFSLRPGQSQDLRLVATQHEGGELGVFRHGSLTLTEAAGAVRTLTMPISIRDTMAHLPRDIRIHTLEREDTRRYERVEALPDVEFATHGLIRGIEVSGVLDSDPTPEYPFNGDGGVFMESISVPEGAWVLFVDLGITESPGMEFHVGKGDDPVETLDTGVLLNSKGLVITNPEPGTWWVVGQNLAPMRTDDHYSLHYMIITPNTPASGTLSVDPVSRSQDPFPLDVTWSLDDVQPGDHFYGAVHLHRPGWVDQEDRILPIRILGTEEEDQFLDTGSSRFDVRPRNAVVQRAGSMR
ncbi:S8 family serine peptidase [Ectothiorhodospira lacustris]|uniref:S8 family serine peptidase n=1 Tax=Ectothiorhodospira lacustris TaxID=2899127 RepID=UPI0032421B5E